PYPGRSVGSRRGSHRRSDSAVAVAAADVVDMTRKPLGVYFTEPSSNRLTSISSFDSTTYVRLTGVTVSAAVAAVEGTPRLHAVNPARTTTDPTTSATSFAFTRASSHRMSAQ